MKRFDKAYIFYHLITDIFLTIAVGFVFSDFLIIEDEAGELVGINNTVLPFFIVGLVLVYAAFIVYRYLYYRTSEYQLTDTQIICRRGVIFRKRSMIECSRIHAINKRQNLIHRLFGIAVLTVDSGSANTANQAEVMIIEKARTVDLLLADLHSLRDGGTKLDTPPVVDGKMGENPKNFTGEEVVLSESDSLYTFNSAGKLLYSLINGVTALICLVILSALASIVLSVIQAFVTLEFLSTFGGRLIGMILVMLGITLAVSILALIISIIQSFVSYYGFKVVKKGDEIVITYGLFETHTNTFRLDRIKGVRVNQGIVKRMLGFATISLEVIGYTADEENDKVTSGVLVPFCKYSDVNQIVSRILPEYESLSRQTSAVSFFPFISWTGLVLALVFVPLAAVVLADLLIFKVSSDIIIGVTLAILGVGLLIFLANLVDELINYKTAGVAIDGDKITLYNGGLSKAVTTIHAKNLVAIENVTTPKRQKKGITTLILHLRTNALTNEVRVDIQSAELVERLEGMLVL